MNYVVEDIGSYFLGGKIWFVFLVSWGGFGWFVGFCGWFGYGKVLIGELDWICYGLDWLFEN